MLEQFNKGIVKDVNQLSSGEHEIYYRATVHGLPKVSSNHTIFLRLGGILISLVYNFILLLFRGTFRGVDDFIVMNIGPLLLTIFATFWALRFWDVGSDGKKIIVSRYGTAYEIELGEIKNLEIVPNLLNKTLPPFIRIIIQKPIDGRSEFVYYSSIGRQDEKFLIEPWRKLRIERTQQSLKKRNARR